MKRSENCQPIVRTCHLLWKSGNRSFLGLKFPRRRRNAGVTRRGEGGKSTPYGVALIEVCLPSENQDRPDTSVSAGPLFHYARQLSNKGQTRERERERDGGTSTRGCGCTHATNLYPMSSWTALNGVWNLENLNRWKSSFLLPRIGTQRTKEFLIIAWKYLFFLIFLIFSLFSEKRISYSLNQMHFAKTFHFAKKEKKRMTV